ncbi:NADPH-dependent F420 reductase [Nocardia terpenica]|nr:NAD(P)-binding domain-containing protein [Nocardia terpenica]
MAGDRPRDTKESEMRITILGTGTMAGALGGRWVRAGHEVTVAGRSSARARELAARLGERARWATMREAVIGAEAVLLAVSWTGVQEVLHNVAEALNGTTLIDPTNPAEHGIGALTLPAGASGAQRIAGLAPNAHVVKAFHLFPADQWTNPNSPSVTVAICGDDLHAVRTTETLVRDAGAKPAVLGGLDRARQLEEAAGFVIGLAFRGFDPRSAIPHGPA